MYEYAAWVTKVVDGDTFHVGIDLGLDIATFQTVRFAGLNAPEMSTPEGKEVKAWVETWLAEHCPNGRFILRTVKDHREKYGRYLGTIVAPDGAVLNDDLLSTGRAVVM
jgi:endonuclease YncB( thermonuclease family)